MKKAKVIYCLALVALMVMETGCGFYGAHFDPAYSYPGPYPGVRADVDAIAHPSGDLPELSKILILDFPFSAALDTVVLPWDLSCWAYNNKGQTNNISQ